MKSPSARYLTKYILRVILGTVCVLASISAVRVLQIKIAVHASRALLASHQPEKAIERLELAQRWAVAYPVLAQRAHYQLAQAYTMMSDLDRARSHVGALSHHAPRPWDETSSPWEKALIFTDALSNLALEKFMPDLDLDSALAEGLLRQDLQTTAHRPPLSETQFLPSMQSSSRAPNSSMPSLPGPSPLTQQPAPSPPAAPTVVINTIKEWGVIIVPNAPVYTVKGNNIGKTPAGTLLTVIDHKDTSNGRFLLCTIAVNGTRQPQALIRREDASIYIGDISNVSQDQRERCVRRARLLAAITDRKAKIEVANKEQNPHYRTYSNAVKELRAFQAKAKQIQTEYKAATGPRRMELADALRSLKHEQIQLSTEYQSEKKKYTDWKAENAASEVDTANDREILRLRNAISAIEQEIATH
jgi:hypothetical protein